jgi:LTXXQ motif family protein
MTTTTRLALAAAALAAGVSLASAQTTQNADPHHPGTTGAAVTQAQPSAPPSSQPPVARGPAQPGAMPMQPDTMPMQPGALPGGQSMMMGGDMAQMMAMMQMMCGGMMTMGMGPAGMQPFRHIEGKIAFYKAELKIADAQVPQWDAFADALGSNATRLQQAMMAAAIETKSVAAAPEQMQRRIAMLTARLDSMQAVLAAAKPLYAVLTDEQKKIADDLMAERMMPMRARGL